MRYRIFWGILLIYVTKGCEDKRFYSGEGSKSGYFWSPSFDKPYPPLVKCRFFFEGSKDERIRFTFNDFDLENGTKKEQCVSDYLDIFSIDETDFKNPIIRVCGSVKPSPVVTLHSRAEIVFTSDRYSNGQAGFHMKYEFLDERWSPFTSDQRCGSTFLNGKGGVITSPGYPFAYEKDTTCSWMIRVREGNIILLNIIDLDIGVEVHCDKTAGYLDVYNGFASLTASQSSTPNRLCGQSIYYKGVKDLSIRSNSLRMTLRWFGGENPNVKGSKGFKLSWTEVYIPRKGEKCNGFQCKGGKSCADSVGLLCHPLHEYCIDESLTCNDLPNCDIMDKSDERHCLTPLLLALCIILPLLAVLGLIVVIYTYRNKRRQKNTNKTESKKAKEKERTMELEKLDTSPRLTARPGEQYSKPIRKKSACSYNGDADRKGSTSSIRKSLTNELNVKFTHTNRNTDSPSIKTSHKKDYYKKSPETTKYDYQPLPMSNGPGPRCGIGPYEGSDGDQDFADFPPPPTDYPPPIDYPSPGTHTYVNRNAQIISPNKSNHSIV